MSDTTHDLKEAIGGETWEFTEMYPPMLERAVAAGHKAARMFKYVVGAEAVHARLYQAALEDVRQGRDLETADVFLCPVCGHIEFGAAPVSCPICGAKAAACVQVS